MTPGRQLFTILLVSTCLGASSKYAHSYYDAPFSHATPWLSATETTIDQEFQVAGPIRNAIRKMVTEPIEIEKHNIRPPVPHPELNVPSDRPNPDAPSGHIVDLNNEASVRKSFVMSKEGQAEISSVVQNHEVQIFGTERELFFTRSVPISQLPADDQVRLTALFKAVVNGLPEDGFKSSDSLTKAMQERLERQLAESSRQSASRYKFDVSSGKLTLPRLGRIGPLEISGGELDTYKLFKRIALVAIACGVTSCKCFVAALLDKESLCIPSE